MLVTGIWGRSEPSYGLAARRLIVPLEIGYDPIVELQEAASSQAKHRTVRDALVELIHGLPPGSGMPTERELCERFGVSRGTVRQALDRLEAEQRIHRHQGKGTFVARPKMDHMLELTSHTSTSGPAAWNLLPG